MRGKEFLDKMGFISPAYIEAAEEMPKKKQKWTKLATAAACFAALILSMTAILYGSTTSKLTMLSIGENVLGMGFEGYMAYDFSEIVSSNPWREDIELKTLPVYKNTAVEDRIFVNSNSLNKKMEKFALEVASRVGLDADAEITYDLPDKKARQKMEKEFESMGKPLPIGYFEPARIRIEAAGIRIEADQTMTATIHFDQSIPLPEEYNFNHSFTYEENLAAAEYLKNACSDLISFADPQINIYYGDYDIYGEQHYYVEFFENGDSYEESIINFNFNRVLLYGDDNRDLYMARIFKPDLSEKMGDYPIITTEQARKLLLNGNYITTAPYELPGEEYIKKVELVYRTNEYEEYFMPYYRFYAELPEEKRDNGLNSYGAYYVPAVESDYISELPIWDGSFNS